jgi:hypothetical protein
MALDEKYSHLFDEINVINRAYGWVGVLDALKYIDTNFEHYRGTLCGNQCRLFIKEMSRLFK